MPWRKVRLTETKNESLRKALRDEKLQRARDKVEWTADSYTQDFISYPSLCQYWIVDVRHRDEVMHHLHPIVSINY